MVSPYNTLWFMVIYATFNNISVISWQSFLMVEETRVTYQRFNTLELKKSLKIPKGPSESVYRRRTDNTIAKEKVQKDKQRSTKHTYKTKDRVTRTPLKTGGEFRCSGSVSSSCSTNDTRRANLVTKVGFIQDSVLFKYWFGQFLL